jgi:hypothetical protein
LRKFGADFSFTVLYPQQKLKSTLYHFKFELLHSGQWYHLCCVSYRELSFKLQGSVDRTTLAGYRILGHRVLLVVVVGRPDSAQKRLVPQR